MCHSVPVFLRARFNPLQFFNALQGRYHTMSQPDAIRIVVKQRVRQLGTGLDKCYTPHFQCQSLTSKRKSLLRLTETEHISFAPVIPTILELKPKLRHFSQPFGTTFFVPTRNYHSLLLKKKRRNATSQRHKHRSAYKRLRRP